MSFSYVGKISGPPSRIVSSVPRLANAPPSSVPIYPPPITTNFFGTSVSASAPVELNTRLPYLKPGISIGRDPVAMITLLNV